EGVLTDAVAAQQISDLLAGLVGAEDLQDLGLREPTLLHAVLLALGSPEDSHIRWTSFRGAGHGAPPLPRSCCESGRPPGGFFQRDPVDVAEFRSQVLQVGLGSQVGSRGALDDLLR